ncbi:MAG: hypothetical protein ACOC3V_02730 [bacterium]
MSHIKQKLYNWKGEYIGEEIIHRPYHKPYNRLYQNKVTEQEIKEGLEEYKSELEKECEVIDTKDRNMQEIRLIQEYAKVTNRDISNPLERNEASFMFIKLGYAYAFSQLYEKNKILDFQDLTDYLTEHNKI